MGKLPIGTYIFNQIPKTFLDRSWKNNVQLQVETKKSRVGLTLLNNERIFGVISTLLLKLHYRAKVTKPSLCWNKIRHISHWNWIEDSDICSLYTYGHLFYDNIINIHWKNSTIMFSLILFAPFVPIHSGWIQVEECKLINTYNLAQNLSTSR